tara:strand:+ start:816 stop:1352 length:537 start_codon:yes stop_codon:yes gene_type:complete
MGRYKSINVCCGAFLVVLLLLGYSTVYAAEDESKRIKHICPDVRVKLTPEQIVQVQNAWGGAVLNHLEKLTAGFNKSMPDDHHQFHEFRTGHWEKAYSHNREKIDCVYKNHVWTLDSEFRELVDINIAMVDLSIVAVKMHFYLQYGKREDLQYIRDKTVDIYNLVSKYEAYKPTGKQQ